MPCHAGKSSQNALELISERLKFKYFLGEHAPDPSQGHSRDSVNGGAQLGAVTRAYKVLAEYNRIRCDSSGSFIGPPSGGMLPQKGLGF